ncbi:MAG: hypothetical protein KDK54_20995 [Leptospiraceae bacterium]|nr:hypothetical protein [Leptospiraceae bacterium]
MKKFQIFAVLMFFALLIGCSSPPPKPTATWETIPNSSIRKIEIDQIRIGDSIIRAQAVLGVATEISHKAEGSEHTWWMKPTEDADPGYETLKNKPADTKGIKFIKLTTDSNKKIIDKQMDL